MMTPELSQLLHSIAVFMDDYYDTGLEPAYYVRKNRTYQLEEAQYHTSWDWLMPCIDKIESLDFRVCIGQDDCQIYKRWAEFPENFIIDADFKETRLENAFDAVTSFIDWWNRKGSTFPAQEKYCEITKELDELINDILIEKIKVKEKDLIETHLENGRVVKWCPVYPKGQRTREYLTNQIKQLFFRAVMMKKKAAK
jgi:hypothetical protein